MGSAKKYYRVKQPYWNNELNELWLKLRSSERIFLKGNPGKFGERRALHNEFVRCQTNFDRKLRFYSKKMNVV